MRLIAFGCSCTDGFALDDVSDAWPSCLGNLLDKTVLNKGYAGASNKFISKLILDFNFNTTDTVVVLWSHTDRTCIIKNTEVNHLGVWLDDKKSKAWIKHILNEDDMVLDLHMRAHYTELYLNSMNIKNYHLFHDPDITQNYKWFTTDILNTAMGNIRGQYPKAPGDNSHPGPLAHQAFAESVYREIKDLQ